MLRLNRSQVIARLVALATVAVTFALAAAPRVRT